MPPCARACLGGLAGFTATALGTLSALILRTLSQCTEDVMLGLAAGMMLAASSLGLMGGFSLMMILDTTLG